MYQGDDARAWMTVMPRSIEKREGFIERTKTSSSEGPCGLSLEVFPLF